MAITYIHVSGDTPPDILLYIRLDIPINELLYAINRFLKLHGLILGRRVHGSVANLDPYWIRIRIGSVFRNLLDPDPHM